MTRLDELDDFYFAPTFMANFLCAKVKLDLANEGEFLHLHDRLGQDRPADRPRGQGHRRAQAAGVRGRWRSIAASMSGRGCRSLSGCRRLRRTLVGVLTVGVPKEIKTAEHRSRSPLTACASWERSGVAVFVETGRVRNSAIPDADYAGGGVVGVRDGGVAPALGLHEDSHAAALQFTDAIRA